MSANNEAQQPAPTNLFDILSNGTVATWSTPEPKPEIVLEKLFPNPRTRELFMRHVMGEVNLPKKVTNQLNKLQETYATLYHEPEADKAFDTLLTNLKRNSK